MHVPRTSDNDLTGTEGRAPTKAHFVTQNIHSQRDAFAFWKSLGIRKHAGRALLSTHAFLRQGGSKVSLGNELWSYYILKLQVYDMQLSGNPEPSLLGDSLDIWVMQFFNRCLQEGQVAPGSRAPHILWTGCRGSNVPPQSSCVWRYLEVGPLGGS